MATPTTTNRGYQKPDPTNTLAVDVARIVSALNAIDVDINGLLAGAITLAGVKTFSASPLVPTPGAGDNTTKAASTAFVQAAIAALVNTAPATLDTLNELAAALGNDPSFATTVTNALSLKASKAELSAAVPAGVYFPFGGTAAPAGYLLCDGAAVSRTTYAALFSSIGTTWGAGDGSTTFNVPDLRGRVPAGKDDMGGTAASRLNVTLSGTRASAANGIITGLSSTAALSVGMKAYGPGVGTGAVINSIDSATQVTLSVNNSATGTANIRFGVVDGATIGDAGGSQTHALTTPQMPAHTHSVASRSDRNTSAGGSENVAISGGGATLNTNSTGGGQAHPNVQPTIVTNYIIKT